MSGYEAIFYNVLVFWYLLFILLIIHLSLFNSLEHKPDFKSYYYDKTPSNKTAGQLSMLLYRKIVPEVITATIILLINKRILKLEETQNDYIISLNSGVNVNKLGASDKFIISMFLENMGDNNRISFSAINKYCESNRNSSEFLLNYQIWLKIIRKESNVNNYYETKTFYSKIKLYKIIAIVLFAINIISGYYLVSGFLMLIPAYFLQVYFFNIYKRTKEANEDYHKWMAFKNYLTKFNDFKLNDTQKKDYLYYGLVLRVDKLDNKVFSNKYSSILNKAIKKCVRRSYKLGIR